LFRSSINNVSHVLIANALWIPRFAAMHPIMKSSANYAMLKILDPKDMAMEALDLCQHLWLVSLVNLLMREFSMDIIKLRYRTEMKVSHPIYLFVELTFTQKIVQSVSMEKVA